MAQQGVSMDEELRRRVQVRAVAERALTEWDTSEALRAAAQRAPRPHRGFYEAGEKVCWWRDQKIRKGVRIPARPRHRDRARRVTHTSLTYGVVAEEPPSSARRSNSGRHTAPSSGHPTRTTSRSC